MDEKKAAAYKGLVKEMAGHYPKYGVDSPINNEIKLWAPYINGENICQEINLYTYWQGLSYAEKTPKIKYLLVGQDWDNPFADSIDEKSKKLSAEKFVERIGKINGGDKNIRYIDFDYDVYSTDKNLIELFKVLGYDILNHRYDELFFTNFCLGYLTEGKVNETLMMHDAKLFKKLCEILEPENILCLGQLTSECAYEALNGEGTWKKNYSGFKSYSDFIENHAELSVNCGKTAARFYPLAHCGGMGTANRNRNLPKQNDSLYYQKQDWKKIYEVNK